MLTRHCSITCYLSSWARRYAWLGYSWMGCSNDPNDKSTATIKYHFPAALGLDYGEPLGLCAETAPGSEVFHRAYSKANVTLDCRNWAGSVTPHALDN